MHSVMVYAIPVYYVMCLIRLFRISKQCRFIYNKNCVCVFALCAFVYAVYSVLYVWKLFSADTSGKMVFFGGIHVDCFAVAAAFLSFTSGSFVKSMTTAQTANGKKLRVF